MSLLLFVQKGTAHRYPVPRRCSAVYRDEQLRDTKPSSATECPYCLRRWPEDQNQPETPQ